MPVITSSFHLFPRSLDKQYSFPKVFTIDYSVHCAYFFVEYIQISPMSIGGIREVQPTSPVTLIMVSDCSAFFYLNILFTSLLGQQRPIFCI